MSVYHFEQGKLLKLCDEVQELSATPIPTGETFYGMAGWKKVEDVDGVYVLYAPRIPASTTTALTSYGYAFQVEDAADGFPWTILVRDDLIEYLEAMRLIQPLFARTTFLEIEAEVNRRMEHEDRAH